MLILVVEVEVVALTSKQFTAAIGTRIHIESRESGLVGLLADMDEQLA